MSDKLIIVVPYGNSNAQLHVTYGTGESDRTFCGRECYGWSVIRDFAGSDMESSYTCKNCKRGLSR